MGFEHRFALGLIVRLALLVAALFGAVWSFGMPGYAAVRIVAIGLALGAAYLLWSYIRRTNVELARFVEAIQFGDFSQRFERPELGSGFVELGAALDRAIVSLRAERAAAADRSRLLEALVDEVPIALLTVDEAGRIEPANKAARKLLRRHQGLQVDDYRVYGDAFADALDGHKDGFSGQITLDIGGAPMRAIVAVSVLRLPGALHRLVSVQPIQRELSRAELTTQTDLVRVLTHEIMNSMTPVTSLARSAAALVAEAAEAAGGDGGPALADARMAVETLARRADGVMHFVETYRQISRTPDLHRQRFSAASWGSELQRLFAADWPADRAGFALTLDPADFTIDADPDLMTQVVINLMRNGAEAASASGAEPRIALSLKADGDRTIIEVADNGPGIPDEIVDDVFLPFFTTKAKGTGVGLSLARQVAVAHGGTIAVAATGASGTRFRIVF